MMLMLTEMVFCRRLGWTPSLSASFCLAIGVAAYATLMKLFHFRISIFPSVGFGWNTYFFFYFGAGIFAVHSCWLIWKGEANRKSHPKQDENRRRRP